MHEVPNIDTNDNYFHLESYCKVYQNILFAVVICKLNYTRTTPDAIVQIRFDHETVINSL